MILGCFVFSTLFAQGQEKMPNAHISLFAGLNVWSQSSDAIKSSMDMHQFNVTLTGGWFSSKPRIHPSSESRGVVAVDYDFRIKNQVFLGAKFGTSNVMFTKGVHNTNGHLRLKQTSIVFSPLIRVYNVDETLNAYLGPSLLSFQVNQEEAWQSSRNHIFEDEFFMPGFVMGGALAIASSNSIYLHLRTEFLFTAKKSIGPFYNRGEEMTIREINVSSSNAVIGLSLGFKLY